MVLMDLELTETTSFGFDFGARSQLGLSYMMNGKLEIKTITFFEFYSNLFSNVSEKFT